MRGLRWMGWVALCLSTVAAVGQDVGAIAPSGEKEGALTVWFVLPGVNRPTPRVLSRDVQQQTAGSFGQTAGSYGTAASNHGQTASSLGQTAGSVGTAASDHGQTSGSFGQTASSYGTAASDHGQTAGSFGQTASSYGQTSSSYGPDGSGTVSGTQAKTVAKAAPPAPNRVRDGMQADLARTLPDLQASFVTLTADELKDKLVRAEGQAEYPDVIVGPSQSSDWREVAKYSGIAMLGSRSVFAQESNDTAVSKSSAAEVVIMIRAQHPEAARAFVVWLREGSKREVELPVNDAAGSAASTALVAAREVLNGSKLSASDPSVAEFGEATASSLALEPPSGARLDDLSWRISVLRAGANARFAVVALRAVASSDTAFGVVHPLVVLRRTEDGRWKVLQISANLPFEQLMRAYDLLSAYTGRVRPAQLKPVAGITQAAPLDGDTRSPRPELWWDNGGGGSLLVVEWQWRAGAGGWTDSRMFFIPDDGPRLQTRITAQFANSAGDYHWRVWTMGVGGQVNLSPWRTVKIQP